MSRACQMLWVRISVVSALTENRKASVKLTETSAETPSQQQHTKGHHEYLRKCPLPAACTSVLPDGNSCSLQREVAWYSTFLPAWQLEQECLSLPGQRVLCSVLWIWRKCETEESMREAWRQLCRCTVREACWSPGQGSGVAATLSSCLIS